MMPREPVRKKLLRFLDLCRCLVGLGAFLVGMPLFIWFMFDLADGVLLFACADLTAGNHSHVCQAIQDFPEPVDRLIENYVPYNPFAVMIVSVAISYIALVVVGEISENKQMAVRSSADAAPRGT
jgi:hypothetical protein